MAKNGLAVTGKARTALQVMAERLKCDPEELKKVIKNSMTSAKGEDGKKRDMTDEEFFGFLIVANSYGLNPMTKEITAFAAKGGGIVPVVSTDGWTRIGVNHPDYATHYFRHSEAPFVTMKGAKPCPEWMEIVIVKQDGTELPIREYLDEVYRECDYVTPWKTHTKRMLRHKTKIQGFREAFGFGGIYDEDEAHRIIEAEIAPPVGKPDTLAPEEITNGASDASAVTSGKESTPAKEVEKKDEGKQDAIEEKKDPAPKSSESKEKNGSKEEKYDGIVVSVTGALAVPVGKIIPAVEGFLFNVEEKTPKKKTLTEYTISSDSTKLVDVMVVTVWGTWNKDCCAGDKILFKNVTVSTHFREKDQKQYGAFNVSCLEKANS
jgi:phage recombination protein Bet